jgi:hypothetical protein
MSDPTNCIRARVMGSSHKSLTLKCRSAHVRRRLLKHILPDSVNPYPGRTYQFLWDCSNYWQSIYMNFWCLDMNLIQKNHDGTCRCGWRSERHVMIDPQYGPTHANGRNLTVWCDLEHGCAKTSYMSLASVVPEHRVT